MKFYYNGKLIRTSKTHIYTHACINIETMYCAGCSSTKEGAEKVKQDKIRVYESAIENYDLKISARKAGKAGFYHKDGRHTSYIRFDPNNKYHTIEYCETAKQECIEEIERINRVYQIVELEAREK